MLLYHYTTSFHMHSIEAEGVLRLTDAVLQPTASKGPDQVVWLSDDPTWRQGWQQGSAFDKSEVRIVVDVPDAKKWRKWARDHGSPRWWMQVLERVGGGHKPGLHWFVVERPIPRAEWVRIEYRKAANSVTYPESM